MPVLLFRYVSFCASVSPGFGETALSNVSGEIGAFPLIVAHAKYGPGLEFRYQLSQFGTGGVRFVGTVVSSTVAHTLSTPPLLQGVCVEFLTVHPLTMCASLSGTALVPTKFWFWLSIVSRPLTTSGPRVIDDVWWRHRLPST